MHDDGQKITRSDRIPNCQSLHEGRLPLAPHAPRLQLILEPLQTVGNTRQGTQSRKGTG